MNDRPPRVESIEDFYARADAEEHASWPTYGDLYASLDAEADYATHVNPIQWASSQVNEFWMSTGMYAAPRFGEGGFRDGSEAAHWYRILSDNGAHPVDAALLNAVLPWIRAGYVLRDDLVALAASGVAPHEIPNTGDRCLFRPDALRARLTVLAALRPTTGQAARA